MSASFYSAHFDLLKYCIALTLAFPIFVYIHQHKACFFVYIYRGATDDDMKHVCLHTGADDATGAYTAMHCVVYVLRESSVTF